MDMWTASAEPDHISTIPTTTTPLILRRRFDATYVYIQKGEHYLKIAIFVS